MAWGYDRTGSLPVAVLMHASLSACAFIPDDSATRAALLIWFLVLTAAL
jgi:hypothetical protein